MATSLPSSSSAVISTANVAVGGASGPGDAVRPSAERSVTTKRGAGAKHKSVGHPITATNFNFTTASFGAENGGSGVKQRKLRGLRKQQQKPETAGAANARAGRQRKILKTDDDIYERDGGEGEDD